MEYKSSECLAQLQGQYANVFLYVIPPHCSAHNKLG